MKLRDESQLGGVQHGELQLGGSQYDEDQYDALYHEWIRDVVHYDAKLSEPFHGDHDQAQ